MKANPKAKYEAPEMEVLEVRAKSSICAGSNRSIDWTYDQDSFNSGYDGWGRGDYGNADEI